MPQDVAAGIGSIAIVPVVVNLRTNAQLQSLQFRVEVAPQSPDVPMIPETFDALSFSTNDFIQVFTAESKGAATFSVLPYQAGSARGLAVTFLGTNANLMIKGAGVAAMLSIPIPPVGSCGPTLQHSDSERFGNGGCRAADCPAQSDGTGHVARHGGALPGRR